MNFNFQRIDRWYCYYRYVLLLVVAHLFHFEESQVKKTAYYWSTTLLLHGKE